MWQLSPASVICQLCCFSWISRRLLPTTLNTQGKARLEREMEILAYNQAEIACNGPWWPAMGFTWIMYLISWPMSKLWTREHSSWGCLYFHLPPPSGVVVVLPSFAQIFPQFLSFPHRPWHSEWRLHVRSLESYFCGQLWEGSHADLAVLWQLHWILQALPRWKSRDWLHTGLCSAQHNSLERWGLCHGRAQSGKVVGGVAPWRAGCSEQNTWCIGCSHLGCRNSVHSRQKFLFPMWNSPPGMLPLQPQRSLRVGVWFRQVYIRQAHKTPCQDPRILQMGYGGCRRAPCLVLPCDFWWQPQPLSISEATHGRYSWLVWLVIHLPAVSST